MEGPAGVSGTNGDSMVLFVNVVVGGDVSPVVLLAMVSMVSICVGNVVDSMSSTSSDGGVIPLPSVGMGVELLLLLGKTIGTLWVATFSTTTSSAVVVGLLVFSVLAAGEAELYSGEFAGIARVVSAATTLPGAAVSEGSVADWLVDGLGLAVAVDVTVVESADVDVGGDDSFAAGLLAEWMIIRLNINCENIQNSE